MTTTTTKKPTHDICFVRERKDQKGHWTTIGAAWTHEDKGGMNLQFDFLPADVSKGRIVVRVRTEKTAQQEAAQ
jgi:hypothetical protein